jgi:chromate transporter
MPASTECDSFPETPMSHVSAQDPPAIQGNPTLWSLFLSFLKIGSTAFGGFMALISVVQSEIVERRKLLTHGEMVDGISLATVLPGPVAVNVVAYVGHKLRGGPGALVSATGVILPSFVLIVALSAAYFRWGQIPAVNKLFLGFIPAVTAIIVHAAWGMARKTILGVPEFVIAVAACLLLLFQGGFFVTLAIIVGAGVAGWLLFARFAGPAAPATGHTPERKPTGAKLLAFNVPLAAAPFLALEAGLGVKLFLTFAGMSVLLFGGGFVFIPLIEQIVVHEQAWLTRQEFIDAIALGQITPGPILISAAFIGYKLMGLSGALIATVAIFLPPAVLMLISAHFLAQVRNAPVVKAVLRGIRPAVVGMIAVAAWNIGITAVPIWLSAAIFLLALVALFRLHVDVAWIIPSAGLAGLLLY